MTTIVTRAGKGSPLTHTEVDTNFTNLNTNKLETAAIPLGTLAAPSISFLSDANTGIYSPAADTLAFVTAGSNRVHITSAGLVGIGTTGPTSLLSLGNAVTAQKLLVYENPGVNNSKYGFGVQSGEFRSFYPSDGVATFGTISTSDGSTFSEKARVDSSGRLLVGTNNAPGAGELLAIKKASTGTEGAGIKFEGTYELADSATQTLTGSNSTLVFISNNTVGDGALFFLCYKSGTVVLIADPNSAFAASDTATKVCVFKSVNTNTFTLKNRTGGTRSFTVGKINSSD